MTIYTVTPESTKQAGTWTSPVVQVTGEEGTEAILWLRGDGLQNEPDTTTMEWSIETSDNGVDGWTNQVHTVVQGNNGEPFYKPVKLSTNIDALVGKYVRTVTTTNERFRFGIDLEVI